MKTQHLFQMMIGVLDAIDNHQAKVEPDDITLERAMGQIHAYQDAAMRIKDDLLREVGEHHQTKLELQNARREALKSAKQKGKRRGH